MSGAARRKTPEERLAEGNALSAAGRHADAANVFRQLIRDYPAIAELRFNLANALKGMGDLAAAERAYREALRMKPGLVDAQFNLANTCRDLGKVEEAGTAYMAVLALNPAHVGAMTNAAALLQNHGKAGGAEPLLRRVLVIEPDNHAAANLMGLEHKATNDLAGAARWLRRAAHLDPDHSAAWSNLGDLQRLLGEFQEAAVHYRTAVALDSGNPELLTNLGIILLELHRPEAGLELHQQALSLNPNLDAAKWNRALASLAIGDLEHGWVLYESRFAAGATPARKFDIAAWEGDPLAGRRLLVWREQGIGDELMWATCLPDVVELGDCVIECDPRLVNLFARSFPSARVRAETKERRPADADCHVAIASLPLYFRQRPESFRPGPILGADPALVDKWRRRLDDLGPGLKVGFSWRSMRARQENYTARAYTKLPEWQSLAALSGVTLVNLQYDDDAAERGDFPLALWPDLDLRDDFDNLSALVTALDGVVSVSNTVAALSGCLGRPVLELALDNDWSLLGTRTRPWFPRTTCIVRSADDTGWDKQISETVALVAGWRGQGSDV